MEEAVEMKRQWSSCLVAQVECHPLEAELLLACLKTLSIMILAAGLTSMG
jgi:hypothetical protein